MVNNIDITREDLSPLLRFDEIGPQVIDFFFCDATAECGLR